MDAGAVSFGIDVSKAWLDVARSDQAQTWRLPNTTAGFRDLITMVRPEPTALIVTEATGPYHVALVNALADAGRTPVVANPLWVRRFAQSRGRLAKTDRVDARLLAAYGRLAQPVVRPVPPAEVQTLKALVCRREDLVKAQTAEKTRRQAARLPLDRSSLDRSLAFLRREIATLETAIRATIAAHPDLERRYTLLLSMPGVGKIVAAVLLATMPELGTLTRKTAGALAGLAPVAQESGTKQARRVIAGGRALARKALFQASNTAAQRAAVWVAHYTQLRARGKERKVALVACARRMLGILNAMLRDNLTWSELTITRAPAP